MNSSHHMSMTLFQMRLKSFLMFMFYKTKNLFLNIYLEMIDIHF